MTDAAPTIVAPVPVALPPVAPSATILDALAARGTIPPISELPAKVQDAARLYLAGKTYAEIGAAIGVCRQTASQYVKQAKAEAALQCEQSTGINHITDSLYRLQVMRDRAWEKCLDATNDAAEIHWAAEARKCEQQINKLKLKTGIIPSDDPEKLYQTPASNKPHGQRNDDPITDNRPRDERIAEIVEKMQRTRIIG